MPIIGAHVSVAGGLHKAISNAQAIGAQCLQIFGASPRSFTVKMPEPSMVSAYKQALQSSGLGPVFLHAAYLVNLASLQADLRAKSILNLSAHLQIADMIDAQGLIFHIGSGKDMPRDKALAMTVVGMEKVLKNVKGKTQLIMENTAGSGNKIGKDAAELGWLLKKLNSKRVKVCVDTAHAFEAGTIKEFTAPGVKKFLDEYDQEVGFANIVAFHINDSMTSFNSHHDRHENIGEGYIGLQGFKNLARDQRLKNMPWILEVPGFDGKGPDKKNVEILKKVIGKK